MIDWDNFTNRRRGNVEHQGDQLEGVARILSALGLDHTVSRRHFLRLSGISIVGVSTLSGLIARGVAKPLIIMDQANGVVVADPTKCVGCQRCELACTEFNDGKAQPSIARVKVNRNLNFGPKGLPLGQRGQGNWGNGLIIQDLCNQCPHPVPCANACPNDAIVVKPPTNARVVDVNKCVGCKICLRSCPWEMMAFDEEKRKATKCFLCDGKPKCVEACPAESLSYVSWRDLTGWTPRRASGGTFMPAEKAATCIDCHKK
jgi:Fe-S-cluster-containing dehydrogenase component